MEIDQVAALVPLLREADHTDVKRVEGEVSLRQFIAGMMAFEPGWVRFLYGVRAGFVRLLGMKQDKQPVSAWYDASQVPMAVGEKVVFFTVRAAEEDRYWIVEIRDTHLDAWLAVIAEPLTDVRTRFHVATVVKYNKWSGPVYFNVIRPFHHLVVGGMARAGIRGG